MLPKILIMMASAGPSVSLLAQATIQNNTPWFSSFSTLCPEKVPPKYVSISSEIHNFI